MSSSNPNTPILMSSITSSSTSSLSSVATTAIATATSLSTSFSKITAIGGQTNKPYTKIFWPIRCIDQKSGYLIGLNTRSFVVCVVDIVTDVPLKELEIILNKMTFDRRMLNCPLGSSPKILGEWIGKDKTKIPTPPNNLHELDIWISMERTESGDPYLRKIYCNEYKIQTSSQIVLYDDTPPYYYTSIPINFESTLSLVSKNTANASSTSKLVKTNNSVFSPTTSTTSTNTPSSPTSKKHQIGTELESTFKQINCSHDIKTILHETIQKHSINKQKMEQKKKEEQLQKQIQQQQQQTKHYHSHHNNTHHNQQQQQQQQDSQSDTDSENQSFFSKTLLSTLKFRKNSKKQDQQDQQESIQIQQSPNKLINNNSLNNNNNNNNNSLNNSSKLKSKSVKDILLSPIYFIIWFIQIFSRLLEKILYIPAPLYKGGRLKDMTTLGTHLDNRIFQIKQLSKQWNHLKKKTYWINNNDDRSSYIEFHNSAWLIFNDILLGIGAGLLLNFFSDHVLFLIGKLNFFLNNDLLKSLILWLMGWPGGFKLNENLDKFFGRLVLYYIDKWNLITAAISPHCQLFLQIVCLSGILGLSFLISVVIDLFYIFTLHISVFYSVSARFYLLQLLLLNSLWNLFRGVKFNPLRKRIDHCDFDVYQLLLGTLLFTLIFFLFPTTAIYYFFFAVFKAGVSIVKGNFALLLHFLNTFPLFNLVIYCIDKRYLPGGVIFEYKKKDMGNFKNNPNIIVNDQDKEKEKDNNSSNNQNEQQHLNDNSSNSNSNSNNNSNNSSLINSPSTSTSISSPIIIQHSRNLSGTLMGSGILSNSTISYHKRNLSQSSASPIPRISTHQLEITYFTIKIKPTNLSTFFLPTIHLIQNTIKTYHPSKLSKCFFMGKPLNKIS